MSKGLQKRFSNTSPALELIAGPGKGRVFELLASQLTIGRADENFIMIPSESVSRVHAKLERDDAGDFVIVDNGSKNGVIVNGQKVESILLQDGDVVQVGAFSFRFVAGLLPEPTGQLSVVDDGGFPAETAAPAASKSLLADPEKRRRAMVYGGAAALLLVVWMLSGETEKKPTANGSEAAAPKPAGISVTDAPGVPPELKTNSIPGLQDPASGTELELNKLPWSDNGVTEAETHFRRGQREFFNKNYHRAIDAFQLALSLNKMHPSARYYLQAALHECESEAKKNYELGVKYFESLQYSRAVFHFQRTISLLQHRPKDQAITESEKYIRLAKQKLQAAELFP